MHDRRTTLARRDLASADLEGRIAARAYSTVAPARARASATSVRIAADSSAERVDQLLFGEVFDVLEATGLFAWGQARRDGYVGYVERDALTTGVSAPTHWVSVPRTFAFESPNIKATAFGPLSLNSLVSIDGEGGRLVHARGAGWIAGSHLTPVGETLPDPAGVAEMFLGAPYLWGGRDSLGLDCSGLVQQALYACGRGCPRDTDQQASLGRDADPEDLRRGDLVFWRAHVGMMLDAERLIHANAHHMSVAIERLDDAARRISRAGSGEPTSYRRL